MLLLIFSFLNSLFYKSGGLFMLIWIAFHQAFSTRKVGDYKNHIKGDKGGAGGGSSYAGLVRRL